MVIPYLKKLFLACKQRENVYQITLPGNLQPFCLNKANLKKDIF
jgi:hypothetical protein